MQKDYFKKIFLVVFLTILLWGFFSFRLMAVPSGLNGDESAIAYNSALISKTLRDENDRFLPVFVLSNQKTDWHQPVNIYFSAIFFKLFGINYFVFRQVSVFITVLSALLLFYLAYKLGGTKLGKLSLLIFITTPIIMIQSHMGLENNASLPFVLVWLIGIYHYLKSKSLKYLILSALALGISFYSYKGMRLMVPVWTILSLGFIFLINFSGSFNLKKVFTKNSLIPIITFTLTILPFFLLTPILESKYAGAVFDKKVIEETSYQSFLLGFLRNFDISFLFIRGDSSPFHSVGLYGALLLSTLPLFLIGLKESLKHKGFYLFLTAVFFSGPLLYFYSGSIDRASRILALIPSFVLTSAIGANYLSNLSLKTKPKFKNPYFFSLIIISCLIFFQFGDFLQYYWFKHASFYKTQESFANITEQNYKQLSIEAQKLNLEPVVEKNLYESGAEHAKFSEVAYFEKPLKLWKPNSQLPKNVLLLSNIEEIAGAERLNKTTQLGPYLHISQ